MTSKTFPRLLLFAFLILPGSASAVNYTPNGEATVPSVCPRYVPSGPVSVMRNYQKIQNLVITASGVPAITINGFSGTQIRNVTILHEQAPGVLVENAPRTNIENVDIYNTGAPPSGAASTSDEINISCDGSPNLSVTNARLQRGSSGIYMLNCDNSKLSKIEGHDERGPFPRGQLVQWDKSNGGSLSDFSSENSLDDSWPEDLVNIYQSHNVKIRNGYVDGDNSPSGDGILVDQNSYQVTIQNVDAARQINGCFGVYGGGEYNVTMTGTRCMNTVCSSVRGAPLSGSLAWAVDPNSLGRIGITSSSYVALCNPGNIIFEDDKVRPLSIRAVASMVRRKPIRAKLCSAP